MGLQWEIFLNVKFTLGGWKQSGRRRGDVLRIRATHAPEYQKLDALRTRRGHNLVHLLAREHRAHRDREVRARRVLRGG